MATQNTHTHTAELQAVVLSILNRFITGWEPEMWGKRSLSILSFRVHLWVGPQAITSELPLRSDSTHIHLPVTMFPRPILILRSSVPTYLLGEISPCGAGAISFVMYSNFTAELKKQSTHSLTCTHTHTRTYTHASTHTRKTMRMRLKMQQLTAQVGFAPLDVYAVDATLVNIGCYSCTQTLTVPTCVTTTGIKLAPARIR